MCYCCLVSSATLFEPVLGPRGTGEAGDFWIEWGLLFCYLVILLLGYFVIWLFVESTKACLVFMIARALD